MPGPHAPPAREGICRLQGLGWGRVERGLLGFISRMPYELHGEARGLAAAQDEGPASHLLLRAVAICKAQSIASPAAPPLDQKGISAAF